MACAYSEFMHGLALAQVNLDRKALSNLAIQDPDAFAEFGTGRTRGNRRPAGGGEHRHEHG